MTEQIQEVEEKIIQLPEEMWRGSFYIIMTLLGRIGGSIRKLEQNGHFNAMAPSASKPDFMIGVVGPTPYQAFISLCNILNNEEKFFSEYVPNNPGSLIEAKPGEKIEDTISNAIVNKIQKLENAPVDAEPSPV